MPGHASQVEDGWPSIVEVLYENAQLKERISSLEALVPKGLGAYSALIKDAVLAQQDANQARELADRQMQQATIALHKLLVGQSEEGAQREEVDRRRCTIGGAVHVSPGQSLPESNFKRASVER